MATKKLNYLLSIAAIAALTMGVTACGSDDKDDEKTDKPGEGGNTNPGTDEKVTKFAKPVLESTTGCLIDDDCAKGLFCFQGQCGKQCDANNACASGTCDSRGRCQTESSRKRNGDAIPADEMILNAEIMERPAQTIYVDMGSESVTATIVLGSHVGPIMYRVDTIEGGGSEFKTVNPEQVSYDVGNDDVIVGFKYTFEIPVGDSSLGSKGNTERVNLITSVGSFDIDLYPRQEISGFYKGAVAVQNFADANVPIRMGIEITPKNARSMNDIKRYRPLFADKLGRSSFARKRDG